MLVKLQSLDFCSCWEILRFWAACPLPSAARPLVPLRWVLFCSPCVDMWDSLVSNVHCLKQLKRGVFPQDGNTVLVRISPGNPAGISFQEVKRWEVQCAKRSWPRDVASQSYSLLQHQCSGEHSHCSMTMMRSLAAQGLSQWLFRGQTLVTLLLCSDVVTSITWLMFLLRSRQMFMPAIILQLMRPSA